MTTDASDLTPATRLLLPELLLRTAAERPDDTAVISGDEHVTFAGLVGRSRGLAGHLRDLGVTADQCVGLFIEPSSDLMIGVWGILFAGGAYLPLAPEYPEERLRYMIEHSGAKVIVAQGHLVERLAALAPADTVIVRVEDARKGAPARTSTPSPTRWPTSSTPRAAPASPRAS